jgi:hypothetical protein
LIAGVQNNSVISVMILEENLTMVDINTCWDRKINANEILIRQQLICLLSTDAINSVAYFGNKIKNS